MIWINISAIVSCTLHNLLHAFTTVRRQGINNTRCLLALTLGASYTAKSQLKAANKYNEEKSFTLNKS